MKRAGRKNGLAFQNRLALLTALAVAAVLFAACGLYPAKRLESQEADGGAETSKEADTADQAEGVQQESQESEEAGEFSPRLARLLNALYANRGSESNPKIREWIVWRGTKMIADGKSSEEIAVVLSTELYILKQAGPEKLERRIQRWKENALSANPSAGWRYIPSMSEKKNRIRKYLHEQYGKPSLSSDMETPRGVIEILVEGMDDLTAAKYLYDAGRGESYPEAAGERWQRREKAYAAEYADRVLAKDPASRDALILKAIADVDAVESGRVLIEHYPTDEYAVSVGVSQLYMDFPEEAVAAITRILPEDGVHSSSFFHMRLGYAYERLDMLYEAADQYQRGLAVGNPLIGSARYRALERGERFFPSIWEERAANALSLVEGTETPQRPPPPGAEMNIAAAYADFAKAYQSAFEMEYALSDATSEGYMNALLDMARAFAKAGDAQRAQDAYNVVRKRHSREEIEQAFRRFDEQERLKRQPPSGEEDDDSCGDE